MLYLLIIDNELIEYYFLDVVIIEIFIINEMIVMIIKNVVMGIIIFMLGIEIFVYINEGKIFLISDIILERLFILSVGMFMEFEF